MWADNCVEFCLLSMSVIELSIFPAKAWMCHKKTKLSKSPYENAAKSKLSNSLHAIVAKHAKPKPNHSISNKFKYQTFSNIEFWHLQFRETRGKSSNLRIKTKFKQGHSILSYSVFVKPLRRLKDISRKMTILWHLWDVSKTSFASICDFSKIPHKNDFVWFP